MMRTNIETDEQLLHSLTLAGEFGVSRVQRLTGWGYNRTAGKLEALWEQKLIQVVDDVPYRYRVSPLTDR